MMNDDDVVAARASGREAVEELRSSGALDALFERLDAGEVEMTGSQGLLPALLKEALERGLAAELSEHLGYEKGQTSTQARSNTRNGTTKKTVISEVGAFEIEVPRDRAGSFTPRLVRKGQRRLIGLDPDAQHVLDAFHVHSHRQVSGPVFHPVIASDFDADRVQVDHRVERF